MQYNVTSFPGNYITCSDDPLEVSLEGFGKVFSHPKLSERFSSLVFVTELSTQDTENEVEHEEGADDDERNKVDPVERAAQRVVGLKKNIVLLGFIHFRFSYILL